MSSGVHCARQWLTAIALVCTVLLAPQALAADALDNSPVPDSQPREALPGIRVALVDSGVNYQLPAINAALARGPHGQIIGYDYWDMDALPFDSHPVGAGIERHGTRTASLLIEQAPFIELVAYRYPRPDMQRMADLVAHADEHAVRIIGMPLGGNRPEQWVTFEAAARQYPHILFVASAGNNARDIDQQPVYPASLALDNMLVVTSADDFGRVAEGVNWGRVSVDYMVPAERLSALQFDGSTAQVSGSSYAVPRLVALLARYLRDDITLTSAQLKARLRQQFANGVAPRQLAQGYIHDPQIDPLHTIEVSSSTAFRSVSHAGDDASNGSEEPPVEQLLPLQILVLDERWNIESLQQTLASAEKILAQCAIAFAETDIQFVASPDYLRDLKTGTARTLMGAVRDSGAHRKLTVVFARDTLMSMPFDAEAFGRGNTRHRSWLTDSVWLTLALQDRDIALAHELFHVLVNSGDHSRVAGSLMLARTEGDNTRLTNAECEQARERSLGLGLTRALQ